MTADLRPNKAENLDAAIPVILVDQSSQQALNLEKILRRRSE